MTSRSCSYTGLKDKNGVEIYECDIVKWHCSRFWKDRNPDIGKVEQMKSGAWSAVNDYDKEHYAYDIALTQGEVIGNIYENPELIEAI
jgi:uncharacterized phage protein (TIGR01671 family)